MKNFTELPEDVHLYLFHFLHQNDLLRLNRVCKSLQYTSDVAATKEKVAHIKKILSDRKHYLSLTDNEIRYAIDILFKYDQEKLAYQLLQGMVEAEGYLYLVGQQGNRKKYQFCVTLLEEKFKIAGYLHYRSLRNIFNNESYKSEKFEAAIKLNCVKYFFENNTDQANLDLVNEFFRSSKHFQSPQFLYLKQEKIYLCGHLIDNLIEQLLLHMDKPFFIEIGYNTHDYVYAKDIFSGWKNQLRSSAYQDGFTLEMAKEKMGIFSKRMLTNLGYGEDRRYTYSC